MMVHPHSPNTDEVTVPKTITVECQWESLHDIEVPDDYQPGDDIPVEWLSNVNSSVAYLTDWR